MVNERCFEKMNLTNAIVLSGEKGRGDNDQMSCESTMFCCVVRKMNVIQRSMEQVSWERCRQNECKYAR